jgi:hypothetical protein
MLEVWLIPQLRDRGVIEDVWLEHSGAPEHFVFTVCDCLKECFLGCQIGHGSSASPMQLSRPPHSPDPTALYSSLWGIIVGKVGYTLLLQQ